MLPATIESISPIFIVADVAATIAFYCDKLGFEIQYQEPDIDPFFTIVQRDGSMVFLKYGSENTPPLPNPRRESGSNGTPHVLDPDALSAEFLARGVTYRKPLMITSEQLLGFEIAEPDGYVLFFGAPRVIHPAGG